MQSIVRIAAAALTVAPLAALAASPTPELEQLALAVQASDGHPYTASKKARYASLARQAEGLCGIYQGQAREICVDEARAKFSPQAQRY